MGPPQNKSTYLPVTTQNLIWHPGLGMQLRLCSKLLTSKQHPKHSLKGGITVESDSPHILDQMEMNRGAKPLLKCPL